MPSRIKRWLDPFAALQELRAFLTARTRVAHMALVSWLGRVRRGRRPRRTDPDPSLVKAALELRSMDPRNPPSDNISQTVLPLAATAAAVTAAVSLAATLDARDQSAVQAAERVNGTDYDTTPASVSAVNFDAESGGWSGRGRLEDQLASALPAGRAMTPDEPTGTLGGGSTPLAMPADKEPAQGGGAGPPSPATHDGDTSGGGVGISPANANGGAGASPSAANSGGGTGSGNNTGSSTGSSPALASNASGPSGPVTPVTGTATAANTAVLAPTSATITGASTSAATGTAAGQTGSSGTGTTSPPTVPSGAGTTSPPVVPSGTGTAAPSTGISLSAMGAPTASSQSVQFVQNAGQWASGIDFEANAGGYQTAISRDGMTVTLPGTSATSTSAPSGLPSIPSVLVTLLRSRATNSGPRLC